MIAKLFDIQNFKVVPTKHCFTISWLKNIMDEYEADKEYLKVYQYLYYMRYPSPDDNPYFHFKDLEKEDQILGDIEANFSTECPLVQVALEELKKMYETPTSRAYNGIKKALDNIATYMGSTQITDGKDGNISQIRALAKDFDSIRQSFKGAYKDLAEEQTSRVRGGKGLAYDQ